MCGENARSGLLSSLVAGTRWLYQEIETRRVHRGIEESRDDVGNDGQRTGDSGQRGGEREKAELLSRVGQGKLVSTYIDQDVNKRSRPLFVSHLCRFTVLYNLSIYQLRRTKTKMRVQLIFAIPRNALRQPLPSSPADTTLGSQFLSFLSLWLG